MYNHIFSVFFVWTFKNEFCIRVKEKIKSAIKYEIRLILLTLFIENISVENKIAINISLFDSKNVQISKSIFCSYSFSYKWHNIIIIMAVNRTNLPSINGLIHLQEMAFKLLKAKGVIKGNVILTRYNICRQYI